MFTCTHMYIHIYICIYIYIYTYPEGHAQTAGETSVAAVFASPQVDSQHTARNIYAYTYSYIHMYLYIPIYIFICTYMYICTLKSTNQLQHYIFK